MKITLENTEHIVVIRGVACRVWQGTTEKGARIIAMIATVGVNDEDPCDEAEAGLLRIDPPEIRKLNGGPDAGPWR